MADSEGIDGLSLSALAQRLGVRVPSLYRHVDGIEDVMAGVADHASESLAEEMEAAAEGKRGKAALAAVADAYVAHVRAHAGRFRAAQRRRAAASGGPGNPRFQAVLCRIAGDYDLRGDDAVLAAVAMRAALLGYVVLELDKAFCDDGNTLAAVVALLDRGLSGAGGSGKRGGFRLPGIGSR